MPCMVILGEKEQQAGTVSVRIHGKGDQDQFLGSVYRQTARSNKPGLNIQNI